MTLNSKISEDTKNKFRYCNLPENYWEAKLDKIQTCSHPELLDEWLYNSRESMQGKGLMITGKYGRGKSAVAAIIAKQCLARGIFSYWVNYDELMNTMMSKEMFSEHQSLPDRLRNVELLIIDEVHIKAKKGADYPLGFLDVLVRTRIQKGKTTIITTNQTPKTLKSFDLKELTTSFVEVAKEAFTGILITGDNLRDG